MLRVEHYELLINGRTYLSNLVLSIEISSKRHVDDFEEPVIEVNSESSIVSYICEMINFSCNV